MEDENSSIKAKRLRGKVVRSLVATAILIIGALYSNGTFAPPAENNSENKTIVQTSAAGIALSELPIKGRAPKTGYTREQFSSGWDTVDTCDIRNKILVRDMTNLTFIEKTCKVATGTLSDPYAAKTIAFIRGEETSDDVQIDHVVALSDAWQKGAQQLPYLERHQLANDPLELLAVDGPANQKKGDGDAATWLPSNKAYRCEYIARQIAVKQKYRLWVTRSEYDAMASILTTCPKQVLPN